MSEIEKNKDLVSEKAIPNVFKATSYREYLREALRSLSQTEQKRGGIKRLAEFLHCHSTFVSQVVNEKSHFSQEQALGFCRFILMNEEETRYYLNLLNRDRAGTPDLVKHFQELLNEQLAKRADMKKRWKAKRQMTLEQEIQYYGSWLYQVLHMMSQIPKLNYVSAMSKALGIGPERILRVLKDLEAAGIVEEKNGRYLCLVDSMHLPRTSPLYSRFASNWRQKVVQDLDGSRPDRGLHYTSLVALSEESANKLQSMILEHLDRCRDEILESPSETLYLYLMDFTPLVVDSQSL